MMTMHRRVDSFLVASTLVRGALLVFAIGLAGCESCQDERGASTALEQADESEVDRCTQDDECTVMPISCCGCPSVGVARAHLEEAVRAIDSPPCDCLPAPCPAVEGSCVGGRCVATALPEPPAAALTGVTELALGARHACALRGEAIVCWGAGDHGQLGDGTTDARRRPASIAEALDGASSIVAGDAHTCALHGGAVSCWGANGRGQLGDGTTVDAGRPTRVDLPAPVQELFGAGDRTCVRLASEPTMYCWGEGALRPEPFTALGNITHLSLGPEVCGSGAEGIRCLRSGSPVAMDVPHMNADLVASDDETCARSQDRRVRCWAAGGSPRVVLEGVGALTGGGTEICASKYGRAECWGAGSSEPRPPPGVGAADYYPGPGFSCAIRDRTMAFPGAGRVQCWGRNGRGQLGDGTSNDQAVAVYVLAPVD